MSDFLGRMATRAVTAGEAAAAKPRLPAVFDLGDAASEAALELVDEEVVAPVPPRPAHDEAHREDPVAPPPPTPRAAVPRPAEGATESRVTPVASPPIEIPPRLPTSDAKHDEREPERPEARRLEAGTPPPSPPVVAAAPVTPASPALVAAARAHAKPAPAAVASDEPPTVRVHIGRLEVRANLQEPPREHQRREPRQPAGLSLADYLRGTREVS